MVPPRSGSTRALAGVFAPRPTHASATLAARLETALEPDGHSRRLDDGPIALCWTAPDALSAPVEGPITCLVDGHIYNLGELAGEPGADAAAVLARVYELDGPSFLARLRGDFAVVLWDRRARTGLLARDQLGGRPLHLHRTGGALAFASELRNLMRMLPATPGPDDAALLHWLAAGSYEGDATLIEGIRTLPPGSWVALGPDGASPPERYWTPSYRRPPRSDPAQAAAAVRGALFRALRRRADDAETTGVLLSGGIDSAGVAGVAAAALEPGRRPRRAYTVTFPNYAEIDEAALTAATAAAAGLVATSLQLRSGSVVGGAVPYIEAWLSPPSSPNLFFLRPLLERARADGTRVLLDGEGGDAVFWHSPLLIRDRIRAGRMVAAWSLAGRMPEYGVPTTARRRIHAVRQWGLTPLAGVPESNAPAWWRWLVEGILGPGSRLLHDVSRRHAALVGLEPRHPLLDVDLIELVLSLPPALSFDRRYNRPLLRHALEALVPDEVRLRPYKSRFDPVLADGIARDLPVVERLLAPRDAEIRRYLPDEPALLLSCRPAAPAAERAWAMRTWQLALAECWLRTLSGKPPLPAAARAAVPAAASAIGPL